MASYSGTKITARLVKRGWKSALVRTAAGDVIYGNPRLIDPVTGNHYSVYEAEEIQNKRDKDEIEK